MLADTLTALERVPSAERAVFVAPSAASDARAELAEWLPSTWSVSVQEGSDLGARIVHVFATLFARGAERVLVTGSDAPLLDLSPARIETLAADEALLCPSDDGGYAAIALRRLEPRLFSGIPWSTAAVADETRRRALEVGVTIRELTPTYDIDEPEDVERLKRELAHCPSRAPRTAHVLGVVAKR